MVFESMSIRVKVELLPGLKAIQNKREFDVELPEGANVRDLFLKIGFSEDEIEHLRVWVGKNLASLHTVLKDSDDLIVTVPLSGG